MIKLFRINTGSCGGCDVELDAAVAAYDDLTWVSNPFEADVCIVTGPITRGSRPAFMALWREIKDTLPLVAIGRCAIDGHPFGRGGVAETPEVQVVLKLDGCPTDPDEIATAIRQLVRRET